MYLNINKIEDKSELEIFEENLIEILDDVFKKKKLISQNYHILIQKVWLSPKYNDEKIKIAKFLLNRLNKELARIIMNASILASKLCPYCNKPCSKEENFSQEIKHNKLYH